MLTLAPSVCSRLDLESPLGLLRLTAIDGALTGLEFLGQVPTSDNATGCDCLDEAAEQLRRYFQSPARGFDLPLAPVGTGFQQRVWATLQDIPCGAVWRYGEVAERLGTAPRAVGRACGANPLPILIPCHRVVGALGLTGYSGGGPGDGLAIKQWLLKHEGVKKWPGMRH
ncbi:Methylated-DNA--protein-cysteine methyltransferase [Gammaproteobacteria bacterium]